MDVELPGRLERAAGRDPRRRPNPDAVDWLRERLPAIADFTICASILADKDVEGILRRLEPLGDRFVATASSSARSLGAAELAARAQGHFAIVEAVSDPSPRSGARTSSASRCS